MCVRGVCMWRKVVCLIVCLFFCLSVCMVSVSASSAGDVSSAGNKSYVMTAAEMDALLSTCVGAYTLSNGYGGSANFVKSSSSSPPLYVLEYVTSGGPAVNASFNLDFSLDLSCGSIKIQEFTSIVVYNYVNSQPVYSTSVAPSYGYFYLNDNISTSNPIVLDGQLQYDNHLVNGKSRINSFSFPSLTKVTGFSSQFSGNWYNAYKVAFVYGIQSIEYTAPAPVVDNLQEAIEAIMKNDNANTDKIIENYNTKSEEIKEKLDSNHQEQIENDNANTDKIIENQDKNHQEQLDHDQQLWNDTFDPSVESVDDLASAIFDENIQNQLKEKLGLFTFLDDTLFKLLGAFEDPGDASTALIFPSFKIPIDGVEYEVIKETPFDIADTLDEIPVLVSAIRFVSGVVIIFGFLGYLHRLYYRVFGGKD